MLHQSAYLPQSISQNISKTCHIMSYNPYLYILYVYIYISLSQFSCHFATPTRHSLRLWCGPGGPAAEPRSLAALYRCPQEANSHTSASTAFDSRAFMKLQAGRIWHSPAIHPRRASEQSWPPDGDAYWSLMKRSGYYLGYTLHIHCICTNIQSCLSVYRICRGCWCALVCFWTSGDNMGIASCRLCLDPGPFLAWLCGKFGNLGSGPSGAGLSISLL